MKRRIESVDILRGFTIAAMIMVNNPGTWSHVYAPLLHAEWHGLTPTDLIFPFFLFIVGISIYFSYKNKPNIKSTYKKIFVRTFKLLALGFILNWFLPYMPFFNDLATVRIPGVLQRIGIVFCISAILYLNCNWKVLLGMGVAILLGYWAFMGFVPLPDGSAPTFDRAANNWANFIDLSVLGEHMWKDDYDPEGILSTFPAIVTCLSGILIGKLLDGLTKVRLLFFAAAGFLLSGYILNMWFPINKAIWSSSFVLVTSGWATLILGVIYFLTDIKKVKMGSIFKYAGMNAITIFFLSSFIAKSFYLTKVGDTNVHSWLYDNIFVHDFLSDKMSSLLYALTVIAFYLGLAYWMYRKKIFIKV
ncbi:heparan-alpha-glucosaminide N-acetyltransferase domain-containing protein [Flavobacteriaceae sp. LMIT009]